MQHRWQLLLAASALAVLVQCAAFPASPGAPGAYAVPPLDTAATGPVGFLVGDGTRVHARSPLMLVQVPQEGGAAERPAGPAGPGQVTQPEQPGEAGRMQPQGGGMVLRPGDVLSISVQGEPELTGQVNIRPDGLIVLPLLGTVEAGGKTVTELADDLTESLRAYVINPIVSVIQIGGVPRVVSVLGAVMNPGTYDVRQYERLLAVLAAAGGPSPDADMERAVLVRDGERARIVAGAIEGEPIIPEDIALQAGDAIVVPSRADRALRVAGAVVRPGLVAVENNLTASRAILSAGGPTELADLAGVQLLRGAEQLDLNLRPLLQPERAVAGEQARDEVVQVDDVLIVPQVRSEAVFVIGAVAAPGPQSAREARTASKAVVMAGGAAASADLSRAYVLRDGEQTPLELTPLLDPDNAAEGAVAVDAPVEPGDVVMVPEQMPIFVIGAVVTPGAVSPHNARTLSQAIVLAGGLAEDANKGEAYVLRAGEQIRVDLARLFDEGDASADLALLPEDAVVVPRQAQVFSVVGEVLRPGTYPLDQAASVLDAWALGGGPTLWADASQALLVRGEETERLNIDEMVFGGDLTQNRELRAGDTLLIPRIEDEVYVLGAVVRPGAHPIHEGDTLIDVIADAGGPTVGADVGRIAVIRRTVLEEARRREVYDRPAEQEAGRPRVGPPSAGRPGMGQTRPRTAPREDEPRDEAERIARELIEGTEAVRLYDLAGGPAGDPAYLVRPGDVIYVPPKEVRRYDLMSILISIASSVITGALL